MKDGYWKKGARTWDASWIGDALACLDTTAVIEYIRGNESVGKIVDKQPDGTIAITAITRYELLKHHNMAKREAAKAAIDKFVLLDFSKGAAEHSAEIYMKLESDGTMINENDILIAGIALEENETLITTDKDFKRIDGLNVIVP